MPNFAPQSHRNGLKWRNGRPRWEPSATLRRLGVRGMDLKNLDGTWIAERGRVIDLADARHGWADWFRLASKDNARGNEARAWIAQALPNLPPAVTPEGQLMRRTVADIIDLCRVLIDAKPVTTLPDGDAGGPTVNDLVAAFFATPPPDLKPATLNAYSAQAKRFAQKFNNRGIRAITAGQIRSWYEELLDTTSTATANLAIGAVGSFYRWALWQDWITPSQIPVAKVGLKKSKGRLVYWPRKIEEAFVAWCDANNFEDVGDAVTMGCWTAARQIDMCKASLAQLADVWTYLPTKTEKTGHEAMAGILPVLRARIDRRAERAKRAGVKYLHGAAPFLFNAETGLAHNTNSIYRRFSKATKLAIRAGITALSGPPALRLQDTRDTCVTRLFDAGIPIEKIYPWTGHSPDSAHEILREHYRVLRKEGARETARQLEAYFQKWGLDLEG